MGEYADDAVMSAMDDWLYDLNDPYYYEVPYHRKRKKKIMAEYTTVFVEGRVYWAKIIGNKALHDNYDGDAREWSYDFVPDDTKFLKDHRLLDRLKEAKDPIPDDYLRLKKPEFTKDGDKNDPIKVIDSDNEPWDNRLLGNGTRVVAKLTIVDWGKGKKQSIWTDCLRVEDLVAYEGNGDRGGDPFSDYKPSAKSAKAAKGSSKRAAQELDLDDDVPF